MTTGSEIREVTLQPVRARPGDSITATVRYRVRGAEPVLHLEVSSGYAVSPPEIPVPRTRTEARVTFVVERDEGERARGYGPAATGRDLCVVTFRLGHGAVMDANLWIEA